MIRFAGVVGTDNVKPDIVKVQPSRLSGRFPMSRLCRRDVILERHGGIGGHTPSPQMIESTQRVRRRRGRRIILTVITIGANPLLVRTPP